MNKRLGAITMDTTYEQMFREVVRRAEERNTLVVSRPAEQRDPQADEQSSTRKIWLNEVRKAAGATTRD